MTNDTVSDALTRIKNGYMASKGEVVLTYSKLTLAILKVLESEGYVGSYAQEKDTKNPNINLVKVVLRYENRKPVVSQIQRVSKPGLRIYKGKSALPRVLNGLGIALISTPKGVMTDKQARKEGMGGEVLAYIW